MLLCISWWCKQHDVELDWMKYRIILSLHIMRFRTNAHHWGHVPFYPFSQQSWYDEFHISKNKFCQETNTKIILRECTNTMRFLAKSMMKIHFNIPVRFITIPGKIWSFPYWNSWFFKIDVSTRQVKNVIPVWEYEDGSDAFKTPQINIHKTLCYT